MILYTRAKPEFSQLRAPEIDRSIAVNDDLNTKASQGWVSL